MLKSRATAGAAAILIVLFTLILLAAILVVTSRLSLGSLRTNADQAATLEAQYAAESNMNYARSVLSDLQQLMSKESLNIPATTSLLQIRENAEQFCDGGAFGSPLPAYVQKDLRMATGVQWCAVPEAAQGAGAASVLTQYVKPTAYAQHLSVDEVPSDPGAFWTELFASNTHSLTQDNVRFRLRPLGVARMSSGRHRFYLGVGDAAARGEQAGATRVLTGQNNVEQGIWWFELGTDNLLNNVLHTDHHRSKAGANNTAPQINFVNQRFYGSVHTNESFLFTNGARTQFVGSGKTDDSGDPITYSVSSAGCDNLPGLNVSPAEGFDCTSSPKVYVGGTKYTGSNAQLRGELDSRTDLYFDLDGNGVEEPNSINFEANYVPLPTNSANQKAAAQGTDAEGNALPEGAGLLLSGQVNQVQLFAGDASGNPLQQYTERTDDSNNRVLDKWTEPSPTYQYIKTNTCSIGTWREVSQSVYNGTPTAHRRITYVLLIFPRYEVRTTNCQPRTYRADKDGNLFLLQSGAWSPQGKFNGMIYGDRIDTVNGPNRRSTPATGKEDLRAVPPALASFSGITIAAESNIDILNDLTMSDPPCRMEDSTCDSRDKSRNMLGIYSQRGDIKVSDTAPSDLMLHSALMTSLGEVGVTNYNSIDVKGDVHLRGALVESWYGAFGTVDNNIPQTGYGRDFTYDERYRDGVTPPYWPVSPKLQTETPESGERSLANLIIRNGPVGEFQ